MAAEEYDIYYPTKIVPDEYQRYHTFLFQYDESKAENIYEFDAWPGRYYVYLWGAEGGGPAGQNWGGGGAMVCACVEVKNRCRWYIYLGEHSTKPNTKSFNGNVNPSTNGCYPGGGASDVRFVYDPRWWKSDTLTSRFMVAGGGGGAPAQYPSEDMWTMKRFAYDTKQYISTDSGCNIDLVQFFSYAINNALINNNNANVYGDRCQAMGMYPGYNINVPVYDTELNGQFGIGANTEAGGGGGLFGGASSVMGYPGSGGSSLGQLNYSTSFVCNSIGDTQSPSLRYSYSSIGTAPFSYIGFTSNSPCFGSDFYGYANFTGINAAEGNSPLSFPRIIAYPNLEGTLWPNWPDDVVTPEQKAGTELMYQPYGNRGHGACVIIVPVNLTPFQYKWEVVPSS